MRSNAGIPEHIHRRALQQLHDFESDIYDSEHAPFSIVGSLTAAGKWILGRGRGVVPGGLAGNVTSQSCEARLVGQHALVFS